MLASSYIKVDNLIISPTVDEEMVHLLSVVEWLREPRPKSYWVITLTFWAFVVGSITLGVAYLLQGDKVNGWGFVLAPLLIYALVRVEKDDEEE